MEPTFMAYHIQNPKAMVKITVIIFFSLLIPKCINGQKTGKEINNHVHFSTFFNDDTLSYLDTLEINIEMTNISNDSITIYPEGIVYLRLRYTNFHKELILVTDRKTNELEKRLLPCEKLLIKFDVLLKEKIFHSGLNEFSVIFITYPYWLKKKDLSKSIFGRWESEVKKIIVL